MLVKPQSLKPTQAGGKWRHIVRISVLGPLFSFAHSAYINDFALKGLFDHLDND